MVSHDKLPSRTSAEEYGQEHSPNRVPSMGIQSASGGQSSSTFHDAVRVFPDASSQGMPSPIEDFGFF